MGLLAAPLDSWSVAALVLSGVAVLGSCLAAVRGGQPVVLRLSHATMALAMAAMLVPLGSGATPAALIALAAVAALVTRHLTRSPSGLPCLVDLIGMALVLALSGSARTPASVVVLVAAGWAVSSIWVRWEKWLQHSQAHRLVSWEASSAVVAAAAMAAMALAMAPG